MRHKKIGCTLSRDGGARKALFRGLIKSFITFGKICTTEKKGKEVKRILCMLFRRCQIDTLSNRRFVFSYLIDGKCVNKLFELAKRNVVPGFCFFRFFKCGLRSGDSAPLVCLRICV